MQFFLPTLFAAAENAEKSAGMDSTTLILVTVAVIAVPGLIAWWLAQTLRMREYGWKFYLILFAIAAGGTTIYYGISDVRLGIDLAGGTNLVYELKQTDESVDFDDLIRTLRLRIDPSGVKELTIRRFGENQIEIIMPGTNQEQAAQIKDKIVQLGTLEFLIVADSSHAKEKALAQRATGKEVYDANGNMVAKWVPIAQDPETGELKWTPPGYPGGESDIWRRTPNNRVEVLLIHNENYHVTGEDLDRAFQSQDSRGLPAVGFSFNNEGARKFGILTQNNLPDRATGREHLLAIVLNENLQSAATIKERITNSGIIHGDFTVQEVQAQVDVLKSGALPAELNREPLMDITVGPQLGADTIRAGKYAIGISLAAVLLFMLFYYRFAGVVACLAVVLTLVLLLALMILFEAAFTLPGLAGVVLTVGMAVDANVLIYERIREEMDRGSTLRMAIRNGFARATTTIVDANLTTLITATVLYVIGTDQVRGFAVTLWLGIVLSMFAAIFCARVLFDVAERKRWVSELTMMRILGHTSFDFLGRRKVAMVVSAIVIVVGLIGVAGRNVGPESERVGMLDIDFTGGSRVWLAFEEEQNISDVRKQVETEISDAIVTNIAGNKQFTVTTANPDIEEIESQLKGIFKRKLAHNSVVSGLDDLAVIEAEIPPGTTEGTKDDSGEAQPDATDQDSPPKSEAKEDKSATDAKENSGKKEADGNKESQAKDSGDADTPKSPDSKKSPGDTDKQSSLLPAGSRWLIGLRHPLALTALLQAEPAADSEKEDAKAEPDSGQAKEPAQKKAEATEKAKSKDKSAEPKEEPAKQEADPEAAPSSEKSTGEGEAEPEPPVVEARGFVGGTRTELEFAQPLNATTLEQMFSDAFAARKLGESKDRVRLKPDDPLYEPGSDQSYKKWTIELALPPDDAKPVLQTFASDLEDTPHFPNSNKIGTQVGDASKQRAVAAILFSLVCIVAYIWFRFQHMVFGLAAVVALVHDVLVTLGAIGLSYFLAPYLGILMIEPFKINLPMVAAFLTIIGYSLNDTIVVFDRVREVRGKSPNLSTDMVNQSVNQTLSRTLLTSVTTLLVVAILYVGGGPGIHGFAFALLIGVVVGTYSSVFVASPCLLWLHGGEAEAEKGADKKVGEKAA